MTKSQEAAREWRAKGVIHSFEVNDFLNGIELYKQSLRAEIERYYKERPSYFACEAILKMLDEVKPIN